MNKSDYDIERLEMRSQSPLDERIAAVKELFPEAVREGKIDFEVLQRSLGEWIDPGKERFGLNWPGKAECMRLIQQPSVGTLVPDREGSVDFDTTQNVIIEGDNLEVLKLLQKSYHGKVKMIYIDPPYNTGNEFVYSDNYKEPLHSYLSMSRQVDDSGMRVSTNSDSSGRFHSNWLSMMYPRLYLARNLLREDGAIFVSIDDHELSQLRQLMNDIFGEENFVECICWNKRIPKNDKGIGNIHEYVVVYVRNSSREYEFTMPKDGLDDVFEFVDGLRRSRVPIPEAEAELRKLYRKKGYDRGITLYNCLDANYEIWGKINVSWPNAETFGPRYEVLHPATSRPVAVPDRGWRWKKETFDNLLGSGKPHKRHDDSYVMGSIWFDQSESTQPSLVKYLKDVKSILLRSVLSLKSDGGIEVEALFGQKGVSSYPKPTSLIKTLIGSMALTADHIVLDFFAGSGTTAHATYQMNAEDEGRRKYILVQLPESLETQKTLADGTQLRTIFDVCQARVRLAGKRIRSEQLAEKRLIRNDIFDVGFRSYNLVESNFTPWVGEPAQIPSVQEQLRLFTENIAHQHSLFGNAVERKRLTEALLTEVLLKAGYELTTPVEWLSLAGNAVASVAEGGLLVCLDASISLDAIEAMVALNPGQIVCLEAGFEGDDQRKVNAIQLIRSRARGEDTTIAFKVV